MRQCYRRQILGTRKNGGLIQAAVWEHFCVDLERKLRLELDDSRGSVRTQAGTVDASRGTNGLDNLPELRAIRIHDREVEVGMVKEVEETRTDRELRAFPFRYTESFFYREIGIEIGWSAIDVAFLRSKSGCWVGETSGGQARIGSCSRRCNVRG
jgi:hypothetical protein